MWILIGPQLGTRRVWVYRRPDGVESPDAADHPQPPELTCPQGWRPVKEEASLRRSEGRGASRNLTKAVLFALKSHHEDTGGQGT